MYGQETEWKSRYAAYRITSRSESEVYTYVLSKPSYTIPTPHGANARDEQKILARVSEDLAKHPTHAFEIVHEYWEPGNYDRTRERDVIEILGTIEGAN